MTLVFLIRHASNDFTDEGKMAGWQPDVHLNDKGRRQAERLAARMSQVKLDAIYSSPLERAVETAQYLAQPRGLEIQQRVGLGEVHVGAWENQKIQDLSKQDQWRMYQIYPSGTRLSTGETGWEMQTRAVREVEAICAAHPNGAIAIVSHADVIKAIVAHYIGIHLDLFQRLIVSPASVTALWLGAPGPRLVRFNDAGPLDELELPPGHKEGASNAT